MSFLVIEIIPTDQLLDREQILIDTGNFDLNIRKVAHSNLGLRFSDETRAKMSAKKKGRRLSDEHRKKLSLYHTGRKASPSTVEANRLSHLGISPSQETRKKLAYRMIGNKHALGFRHGEEARSRMRDGQRLRRLREKTLGLQ